MQLLPALDFAGLGEGGELLEGRGGLLPVNILGLLSASHQRVRRGLLPAANWMLREAPIVLLSQSAAASALPRHSSALGTAV